MIPSFGEAKTTLLFPKKAVPKSEYEVLILAFLMVYIPGESCANTPKEINNNNNNINFFINPIVKESIAEFRPTIILQTNHFLRLIIERSVLVIKIFINDIAGERKEIIMKNWILPIQAKII